MSPSPPELFPQRPVRSDFGRAPSYRVRRIITVTIVVAVLAGGARLIFGDPFTHSGEIATIKAEGAWKQKPEQPGGIDIPNQDVQVYKALDSKDNAKAPVEHLLPPPETPLPLPSSVTTGSSAPSIATTVAPSTSSAPSIENLTPPKLEIDNLTTTVYPSAQAPASDVNVPPPAPITAPVAATESPPPQPQVSPTPAASPVNVPAAAHPATPAHAAKPKPAAPAQLTMAQVLKDAKSVSKTDRIVQVASVQDEASAQAMAEKLQIRYASILGSAQLRVVQANVAGKGTYYRIQSQPVPGDHASGICAALQKMKAGCILVRP